jgi:hypothetical protein
MTLAPTPRPTRFPLHTAQADLITRSHGSIRRLLDAFDPEGKGISKAGLVINLLRSQGTIADTYGKCESGGSKPGDYLGDGRVRPPDDHRFLSCAGPHQNVLRSSALPPSPSPHAGAWRAPVAVARGGAARGAQAGRVDE